MAAGELTSTRATLAIETPPGRVRSCPAIRGLGDQDTSYGDQASDADPERTLIRLADAFDDVEGR
jgi:hypothetical protein